MAAVRIKICGITSVDDALQAVHLGADAIGLNFFPKSKRYISPGQGKLIASALPPFVDAVGVFVNEPLELVRESLRFNTRLRIAQWHGDDAPLPPDDIMFVPSFPIADSVGLQTAQQYLDRCRESGSIPPALLIDGFAKGEYGGTGNRAAWDLLAEWEVDVPLILAGGLTPDNVSEAVRAVKPFAIDVASGVESSPGCKDAEKMRRFIDNARTAAS